MNHTRFPVCMTGGDVEDQQVHINCAVVRGIELQGALLTPLDSLPQP